MFDRRSIIVYGCIVAAVFLSEWLVPESDIKHPISFALTIAAGVLAFWLTRFRLSAKEKQIKAKIEQLKSEGQELSYEQEVDLTPDDFVFLKKQRVINIAIILVGFLILGSIALLSIHFLVEIAGKILIEIGAALLLIFIFVLMIRGTTKKVNEVIRKGKKSVVRGFVTDKRIEGDETDTYVLVIDNLALDVKEKVYSKYQVGDGIEVHVLKNYYSKILHEEKIESMSVK
jgi:hypothetical protein